MSITQTALMQQRRDTAANWTSANPTLLAGEIGIESDTNKIKLGTGSTAWTSLGYTPWSQVSAYPLVNADIAAAAAIAYSKLATLTSANIVLGSSANVATSTPITGDISISNTGVTAIASGVIVNADINASAAIAGTKISPDFGAQTIVTTGVHSAALGAAATPSLTFTGDLNTGIYSPGADQLAVATNGVERVEFGTAEVVFNDGGTDYDFRIEGDTNANLFFVDASTDRVGIGSSAPGQLLQVGSGNGAIRVGTSSGLDITHDNSGFTVAEIKQLYATTSDAAQLKIISGFTSFHTGTSNTERARIDSSGRLLVGTTSGTGDALLAVQGRQSDAARGGILQLRRGQAASALSAGDDIGAIRFSDNTSGNTGFAEILCASDGASGASDFPGRLVFSTTVDGGSSPTGRAMIDKRGVLHTFAAAGGDGHLFMTGENAGTTYYLFAGFRNATAVSGASASMVFQVFTNGNTQNTNNSYAGISDLKLKENIVDATSQWDDLKALQVRKYNFKEETGHQTHTQIGLIAQEVELVSPGLVNESPDRDEDGNDLGTVTKSVNYSVLYMKAVKTLQEAMERIEQLETINTDLLARVIALETA